MVTTQADLLLKERVLNAKVSPTNYIKLDESDRLMFGIENGKSESGFPVLAEYTYQTVPQEADVQIITKKNLGIKTSKDTNVVNLHNTKEARYNRLKRTRDSVNTETKQRSWEKIHNHKIRMAIKLDQDKQDTFRTLKSVNITRNCNNNINTNEEPIQHRLCRKHNMCRNKLQDGTYRVGSCNYATQFTRTKYTPRCQTNDANMSQIYKAFNNEKYTLRRYSSKRIDKNQSSWNYIASVEHQSTSEQQLGKIDSICQILPQEIQVLIHITTKQNRTGYS